MPANAGLPAGLSAAEANRRLAESGPNEMVETAEHPLRRALRHFWAPVPWMLEVTILLQLVAGEGVEAAMVAALLLINVVLAMVQEGRASATLALLRQRLAPRARVRRDGSWSDMPAAALVQGDIVQISLGGIVPADLKLLSGSVLLDQSMLTGESVAVERGPDEQAYAGALVNRGEAVAEVTATGARTYFGRTAELVRAADVQSSEQKAVLGVVKALTAVNMAIVVGMVAYAYAIGMTLVQIIPLVLAALLSAVPVAMPAVFTLAAALGARRLADEGVLLARLSALQEAAMIDVLCVDKTGTLTMNSLSVSGVVPLVDGLTEAALLSRAAAASSADGQDRVDAAIRAAAAQRGGAALPVIRFTPFDPATKMAEALIADPSGAPLRIAKGSPIAIAALAPLDPSAQAALKRMTGEGSRVLAIAAGAPDSMAVIGLIGLSDPPRPDSAPLLAELRGLGIGAVMVTGDTAETAGTVARTIGLQGPVCPPGKIPESVGPRDYAVYAGVFPEDKFRLVRAFQRQGHAVGMCGDGANDAPALRQAQMGIAVASATDVAKSAAGLVLTAPGLRGILACIEEGRAAFQRVLTFTLGMLVNKAVTLIVMGGGLVMTGHAVMTPLLQAIWMLTGDIPMMARAADRAKPTPYPNAWKIRELVLAALPLGSVKLLYVMAVLALGWFRLKLDAETMRTLTFLTLVLAGQMTGLVLRARGHVWHSRPALVLLAAIAAAAALASALAWAGWFMAALPGWLVLSLYGGSLGYGLVLDLVKVAMLRWLPIDRR
ncbi:MAG TPA: HAD-IC family P-type ATPase [Hypericibacter adhaerens]|uniref:HAD-IC family P-type ATPase n=1 Tax=Hypericibacter adhaerens TaxID=2602016 RepID=UPI002C123FF1|nr:HAD-IC family P-type ATPase [Hypericibacter adhaerens]HWA41959.1 HAD-IC family P-type ATPase [Hypericibacter adhaerens]